MWRKGLLFSTLFLCTIKCDDYSHTNWKFHFIPGTGMGILVALAVPINLPNKNVYLAYNFEANYAMPGNETHYEFPPLIERSVDRALIYSAMETKLNSSGYAGKACLLRTICESSLHSVKHSNGILGDILHIIFTPSTTVNNKLPNDYELAEIHGSKSKDCTSYNKNCKISFLNLISWIGQSI